MEEVPTESGSAGRRFVAAVVLLGTIATVLGLLCIRIEPFDDGALLMGARMTRAGALPYVDFYTLYGPFGYTLLGWLLGVVRSPPLAPRLGHAALFSAVALLAWVLDRRTAGSGDRGWAFLLFLVALSATAPLASFFAFALAVSALLCFAMGEASARPASAGWTAACGALLALTALTRPAFTLYVGAGLLLGALVDGTSRMRRLAIVGAVALVGFALVWLSAYSRLPWRTALEASLLAPGRLAMSGARSRLAPFLEAPPVVAFAWGASFVAAILSWAIAARTRGGRFLAALSVLLGGLAALWLRRSAAPGREAAALAGGLLVLSGAIAYCERAALRESPRLRAAVLFGLTAAAFSHYFWSRQDRAHVLPLVALAAAGAALAIDRVRVPMRLVAVALLVLMFAPATVDALPVASLLDGGLASIARSARRTGATLSTVWPCTEVPADAARAVALADRGAAPTSRFVAVASSQAQSVINPVILFLLSRRLPYTKWYTYDPGVQDSAAVQAEMSRDLGDSGSATAVVWRAPGAQRTAFDTEFDRLYPVTVARFGDYEVRGSVAAAR